ncbi:4'-phosphopantetheinyl transferase superfamily protein [Hyunsoonleella sp. 2307UL5-6]|uniref:4'-phosphopantetheinyl transferase family protein n=1 Tax=Hyunsoonleella sp. 2307UL5-6 TaxID=3384768 RepID=UPI0039BCFA54
MVGNDIVDINEAKNASNWQRPRFLDKLFTTQEQVLIQNASNPFLKVWRLWSMKEAAYKLYTQHYPSRFYNPKRFECFIHGDIGVVKFQEFQCYVSTKITSQYIMSEARQDMKPMTSKVIKFETKSVKNQSEIIRKLLLKTAGETFNISKENLKITNSKYGVPSININSKIRSLSLTHHGNYGAYALS